MCVHTRIIYVCGHYGWGAEARACNAQEAYLHGWRSEECDTMHSHPMNSFKVPKLCKRCEEKKRKTDGASSRARSIIDELKSRVEKGKKGKGEGAGGKRDLGNRGGRVL